MNESRSDLRHAVRRRRSCGRAPTTASGIRDAGLNLRPGARGAARLDGAGIGQAIGQTIGTVTVVDPVFSCRNVDVHYGSKHAIKGVSLDVGKKQVLAMIGPSGCGKSTFLRCLNRMNDTIAGARVTGPDPAGRRGYP